MEENKISIIRISTDTIMIDGMVCVNVHGVYCPEFGHKLGSVRINAMFDWLKAEREILEMRDAQKAEVAVHNLLSEMNFKYKLN